MSPHASAPRAAIRDRRLRPGDRRVVAVWSVAVAIAVLAWLLPPYAQNEAYHRFADQRTFLGVPNFLDVTSNLAFLLVGVMGLHFVLRGRHADGTAAFEDPAERWCWGVACAAIALTCCGSWYYHLLPDGARLMWDRLPMAVAFAAILAATVSERISASAGLRLLGPLATLGAGTVWYWRWSVLRGTENLNPYGALQFGSLLLIVLMIAVFPSRYTRGSDMLGAVLLYGLAKFAEHYDSEIFAATGGVISGHTLKHLLAAAAMFWLLRMLRLRRPVRTAAATDDLPQIVNAV